MKRRYLKGLVFTLIAVLLIAAAMWVWWQMPEHGRSVLWKALTSVAAILAVLAALAEFTGWNLRELWAQLRGRLPKGEYADFPFYVVHSYDDLVKRLFPEVSQSVIPDRSIRYQPRGLETTLDELFQTKGRILIRGRSKAGKTRETAELLRRHWHSGLAVLLLQPNEQLQLPFCIPDEVMLPHRNLVLLVDDIDHYCVQGDTIASVEASESARLVNFPERLHEVVHYFEARCGAAREVRVLMTVRREDEFWNKLGYHPDKAPWDTLELFDLPDVPVESAQSFLQIVGKAEGLEIDPTTAEAIAAKNEGTLLNLVWALRDWKQEGLREIGQQQVEEFEGQLARTWKLRYQRSIKGNPDAKSVYAAIDILRHFGLTPHRDLVIQVSAVLDSPPTSVLSDRMRLRMRQIGGRLFWSLQRGVLLRTLSRWDRLYREWKRLAQTRFGKFVSRNVNALALYELPNARRMGRAVNWLARYEIPCQNDILAPYDGQVDGRGASWLKGEGIGSVLLPESGMIPGREYLVKLLRVADQLQSLGNLDDSADLLDRIIRSGLEHEDAYSYRGWVYRQMENYEKALGNYDRALELNPNLPFVHMGRAWTYLDLKEYEKAIADATKAASLWARPANPYRCQAMCYAALGNHEAAIDNIDRAIANNPEGFWLLVDKARIQRDRGHFDDAIQCIEEAIQLEPELAWLRTELGITQRFAERYDEAIEAFGAALELDPANGLAHAQRGITLGGMRRYDEALEALDRAVALEPERGWMLTYRGITLRQMDRHEEALEAIDKAVALDSEASWIYAQRGITLRRMDRYEEALEAIDHAVELDPENRRTHLAKVETLLVMGDVRQADIAVHEGLSKVLEPVRLLGSVGWVFYEMGYLEKAIEYSKQALTSDANQPWIHHNLALALLADGQTDEALAEYDAATAISRRVKEFQDAIHDLEELANKAPDLAGVETALTKLQAGLESLEHSREETEN
jgi:tetratricopeptide (TPR) repeat protein